MKISPFVRFLQQFHSPLIYVLLVAALVTGFFGHLIDTAVILGVVIANVIIGFIQEGKAESSIEAVAKCKTDSIRVVMITGDHAQTAKAIARRLGIGRDGDKVLTGEELSRMNDEELYEVVDEVSVYARVAPEHKFRIVTQLQRRGHIVAVTDDGVNDFSGKWGWCPW